MLKSKLLMLSVALSVTLTAFSGMASANEEQSARAGQALADWIRNFPEQAPKTDVKAGVIMIYRKAGDSNGVAARVTAVARYKSHLFVSTEFGTLQLIDYVTESGAAADMDGILAGKSIDASSCMEEATELSSEITSYDPLCRKHSFTLKAVCGELTSVPLLSKVNESAYDMQDIEAKPLTGSSEHCYRSGPKF